MRHPKWSAVLLALAVMVTGCEPLANALTTPVPTPAETLPVGFPPSLARVIGAAERAATALSQTPAILDTLDPVDLAGLCDATAECNTTKRGWRFVFDTTARDGSPSNVTVVVDADGKVVFTQ